MYTVGICDDQAADIEYISRLVKQWAAEKGQSVIIRTFPSAEAFWFSYEEEPAFDILLLDIEMAQMDGVSLARQVRAANRAVQIVFVSGYTEYIADGYEVEALHYLLKPVSQEKLSQVLSRAVEKLTQAEKSLLLETSEAVVRVPLQEILYAEVQRNYVTVYANAASTSSASRISAYTVKMTLSELESRLGEGFMRTGRSFIVSLKHVRQIARAEVTLSSGDRVPLARGYYEKLNRAMIEYF